MKNKYLLIPVVLLAGLFMGAVGDTFTSLMINSTSGVILNKQTLTHSNSLRVVTAPSVSNDVVRLQDLTSATNALASFELDSILARIGTSNGFGTNTTLLYPATIGLTNTGGFFLGGNGTIGTNGSASILTINASPVVSGSMTVSNVALTYPQWVDTPVSYAYSAVGPSAPTLVSVSGSSPIQLLGFNNSTLLYGLAQWPHNIAVTNATTPVLYYEPHVHFSVVNAPAPGATNVTWRLIWQYGEIGIPYGTRCFTNTVTMSITTSNVQYLAEFGHFTNNNMGITGIFRCRLDRPASAVGDYDSAATVLLNGFDIHVPIANFTISGSRQDAVQ